MIVRKRGMVLQFVKCGRWKGWSDFVNDGCLNLPAVGKLGLIRFEDDKIAGLSEPQIVGWLV